VLVCSFVKPGGWGREDSKIMLEMNGIRETTGRVWIDAYLYFRSVPVWMEN
jgi:hypothetical protein